MNRVNRSIFIFGVYSFVMGVVLLFFSKSILPIFGLPVSQEPWIFLLGFVLCCSSYYYLRSAFKHQTDFAKYTVHTRAVAPVIVAYLILTGKADLHFVSFGIIDGLGGLWTWLEIKRAERLTKKVE